MRPAAGCAVLHAATASLPLPRQISLPSASSTQATGLTGTRTPPFASTAYAPVISSSVTSPPPSVNERP